MAARHMRWVVSAYAVVSWSDGRIEITSAASGATFVADHDDLVRLVHAFARPRTIEEVIAEAAPSAPQRTVASIDNLIRAGVLTPASEAEVAAAHHWDWSALAFHRRSRRPGFQKRPAASALEAKTPRSTTQTKMIRLSEVGGETGRVLDARRSWREWPTAPIGFDTFSRFFWLSARTREPRESRETITRPYPSAGAAYSLEIYPVLAPGAVESIDAGVFRYQPARHALEVISQTKADALPFLEAAARSAGSVSPPVVLIITSRFASQSESYGTLAYSLVLKEVGCLFQTLYLVAESLGLAPCALGGGSPTGRLARLVHTSEVAEPVVGEFMLGPR
jgi:SagB-type dehydrogenase family enzyme